MGQGNPNPTYKIPKGVSGNPNGRPPRAWTWAGLIEQFAEELSEDGKNKQKDAVVKAVFKRARQGDVVAAKELWNRTDGMPTQKVEQDVNIKSIQKIEDTLQSLGIPNDPS